MSEKPKPDETEEKPKAVKDTLEEALETVDRTFDGEPVSKEEGAGEDSAMSGHPATESEEPEKEIEKESGSEEEAGKETPEETPKATPKYKSHEEAETAAAEGQRQITKLAMQLQESNDLLLKTLAGQRGEQSPETPVAPSVPDLAEFVKERRKEVLDEIEKLDPDDNDYKEQVANAQAKADSDILKHYQDIQDANRKAEDERRSEEESRANTERANTQTTINQAQKAMKEAGLNSELDSADSVLFWSLSQLTPKEKDGVPVSMDDQIAYCIDAVNKYKNEALDNYKTEEAKRLAEKTQEDQPLDRGAGGPSRKDEGKPEAAKPVTLSSVVDAVTESRRV